MSEHIKANVRAKEILCYLKEHGPLSFRALKKMVSPPMHDNALRAAIIRLMQKQIVKKRYENLFRNQGVFYQLSQNKESMQIASRFLNCAIDELRQPDFRYRELLHTQECGMWAHKLQKYFPKATIIRDFKFDKNDLAKNIMMINSKDCDIKPDLLLIFKNDETAPYITIAIEIERTRKTNKRLLKKLNNYANQTRIDGLLYVCESDRLKDVIAQLYQQKLSKEVIRVKHYLNNFFMFTTIDKVHELESDVLINSLNQHATLKNWINFLQENDFNSRRDKNFTAHWGSTTSLDATSLN